MGERDGQLNKFLKMIGHRWFNIHSGLEDYPDGYWPEGAIRTKPNQTDFQPILRVKKTQSDHSVPKNNLKSTETKEEYILRVYNEACRMAGISEAKDIKAVPVGFYADKRAITTVANTLVQLQRVDQRLSDMERDSGSELVKSILEQCRQPVQRNIIVTEERYDRRIKAVVRAGGGKKN